MFVINAHGYLCYLLIAFNFFNPEETMNLYNVYKIEIKSLVYNVFCKVYIAYYM